MERTVNLFVIAQVKFSSYALRIHAASGSWRSAGVYKLITTPYSIEAKYHAILVTCTTKEEIHQDEGRRVESSSENSE